VARVALTRGVGAALGADHARGEPADDFRFGQDDFHDDERRPAGDDLIERLRLGNGAREAVEQEAGFRIRVREALGHHAGDDLIVDKATAFHDGANFAAQWRPGLDGLSEHRPR
jgi:hypothetical protein